MKQNDIKGIGDALVRLFAPFCEVIIHDLATERVEQVIATHSDREVGEPSYLDEISIKDWTDDVHGPYRRTAPDGQILKSISVVLRDDHGDPSRLMCINMNVSQFDMAEKLLATFTSVPEAEKSNPLANDWLERLHQFIAKWTAEKGIQIKDLQMTDRRMLLAELQSGGVFAQKHAALAVAKALGVSRATVYQDLRAMDESSGDT